MVIHVFVFEQVVQLQQFNILIFVHGASSLLQLLVCASNIFSIYKWSSMNDVMHTLTQRCPTHSQLATCGEWPFKCGEWVRF